MGVLEKITEYLIKKQWIIFLVSLLVGLLGVVAVPDALISALPFTSHDVNVAVCYAGISIVAYLVLSLLLHVVRTHKKRVAQKKEEKYFAAKTARRNKQTIEQYKKVVDSWSDRDYSIVMYLLENENKVPYLQFGFHSGDTILDNENLFNKAPYSGQKIVSFETAEGVRQGLTISGGYQYLLTQDAYEQFKYIIDTTGSLSHFPKSKIDLEQ